VQVKLEIREEPRGIQTSAQQTHCGWRSNRPATAIKYCHWSC